MIWLGFLINWIWGLRLGFVGWKGLFCNCKFELIDWFFDGRFDWTGSVVNLCGCILDCICWTGVFGCKFGCTGLTGTWDWKLVCTDLTGFICGWRFDSIDWAGNFCDCKFELLLIECFWDWLGCNDCIWLFWLLCPLWLLNDWCRECIFGLELDAKLGCSLIFWLKVGKFWFCVCFIEFLSGIWKDSTVGLLNILILFSIFDPLFELFSFSSSTFGSMFDIIFPSFFIVWLTNLLFPVDGLIWIFSTFLAISTALILLGVFDVRLPGLERFTEFVKFLTIWGFSFELTVWFLLKELDLCLWKEVFMGWFGTCCSGYIVFKTVFSIIFGT